MGILPLKKCVNRDKCSFATKQRMFGVFAIDEILRYRGTWFPSSRTLCHPAILISFNTLQITECWYAFEFKTYQFRAVCNIRSISAGKVYFIIIIWFDWVSLYRCMCVCIWRGLFMFLTIHGPKWDQPICNTSIFLASGWLILMHRTHFIQNIWRK